VIIMSRHLSIPAVLVLVAVAACPAPTVDDGGGGDGTGDDVAPTVDDVLPQGAAGVCRVLFSCCDDTLAAYFAPVANAEADGIFGDLRERVPPAPALTEAECPALVEEIHRRKGLGPFVTAARDGLLAFDAAGLQACLDALDEATCGQSARDVVFDSTCFGLEPPEGGDAQRRMFTRTAERGECRPLADGFGGLFFGTCNPATSFCCVVDDSGDCGIPGPDDVGTCALAAAEGEVCSPFAPVLPCATGLECIPGAGPNGADGCLAPSTTALAIGEACYDSASFRLTGQCTDGWCDILGSDVCQAFVAPGGSCSSGEQCGPGKACVDGVCADNAICAG
jgi:hypothetical protein